MKDVLLVEDDDAVALVVEALLTQEGLQVRRVTNGSSALSSAAATTPDILITDLNLDDGMDGAALAGQLRVMHPLLPVVLISGTFDDGAAGSEAFDSYVCLAKPFRRAALIDALSAARGA